jgi:hypothetical protein
VWQCGSTSSFLELQSSSETKMLMQCTVLFYSTAKKALPVKVISEKNDPNISQEDTLHHTVVRSKLTAHSSIMFEPSIAQYTQLC